MDERKEGGPRKRLNDKERAALAEKLDEDIDRFMDDLAARKQSDGEGSRKPFDFDEWCRDLDQHPAFMTELKPNEKGEYSDAVAALQALKYDEGDTVEERCDSAEQHKTEGNKHFKYKKYRWAVDCYTNGIKVLCADRALNSVLFANRAAAAKRLGNLRSAVRDCVFARRFDPLNSKAVIRGAECLLELGYGKKCIEWIDSSRECRAKLREDAESGAPGDPKSGEQLSRLDELRSQAVQRALIEERDLRKARVTEQKEKAAKERLLAAFAERKLKFRPPIKYDDVSAFEWSNVELLLPQTQTHQRVSVDDLGVIHWPVLIQYPETGQTDLLTECSEESTFGDVLRPVFETPAAWDSSHRFAIGKVRLFISLDVEGSEVAEVFLNTTLRDAFSTENFVIVHGLPVLQMYTKDRVNESFVHLRKDYYRVK